jgi:hypothetical protein
MNECCKPSSSTWASSHPTGLRTLASNQSAAQILADAVAVRLPKWVLRAATGLPTETFNIIRTAKSLANRLGERIIREKMDVARQGLAVETDVFDMLCEFRPAW